MTKVEDIQGIIGLIMEKGLTHYTSYSYQKGRKYNTNLHIFLQATCFSKVKTFGKLHRHNLGTFKMIENKL